MTTRSDSQAQTHRLSITIPAVLATRLQRVRSKKDASINVSQICAAALAAELDRLDKLGRNAEAAVRLRGEMDRRRGKLFRSGFAEGRHWAADDASWAEISGYGKLKESDVVVHGGGFGRTGPVGFEGAFVAPPDYEGAPSFKFQGQLVTEPMGCDQYWRGWLTGVLEVFDAVKDELPPIEPRVWKLRNLAEEIPF